MMSDRLRMFALGAATLMLEVLLTRIAAVTLFANLAFAVIAVSLFGLACASAWAERKTFSDERERDRYAEEWCADLERIPGKITKLGYAATVVLLSVPRLRRQTRRSEREVPGMRAAAARAAAALDAVSDIDALANLIASGVVCSLGFRAVAVNLIASDAGMRCVVAIGPQEMRDQMLGTTCARAAIDELDALDGGALNHFRALLGGVAQ